MCLQLAVCPRDAVVTDANITRADRRGVRYLLDFHPAFAASALCVLALYSALQH